MVSMQKFKCVDLRNILACCKMTEFILANFLQKAHHNACLYCSTTARMTNKMNHTHFSALISASFHSGQMTTFFFFCVSKPPNADAAEATL